MKARALLLAIAILPLQAANAVIVLDEFGAFTTTSWGTCDNTCDIAEIVYIALPGPTTGGQGVLSTMQTLDNVATAGAGDLFASATILPGGFSTPLLSASATSNSNTYASIQAVTAQGYDVIGGGNGQTINYTVTLTGAVVNPGGDATGLVAHMGTAKVVNEGEFTFLQALFLALFDPDGVQIMETTTDDSVNVSMGGSIMVDQGDQFYLGGFLAASAGGLGASAISDSTLHVTFDDPDIGLILAAAGVPLPASVFLLIPALALLAVRRRSNFR